MKKFINILKRLNIFFKNYWLAEPAIGVRKIIIVYLTLFSILFIGVLCRDYLLITLAVLASLGLGTYLWLKMKKYGFYHREYSRDLLGNQVEIIKYGSFKKDKLRLRTVFNPLGYQKIFRTKNDRKVLFRYPSENDFRSYRRFINRIVQEDALVEVKSRHTYEKAHGKVLEKITRIQNRKGVSVFVFWGNRIIGEGFITMGEGKRDHAGVLGYIVDKDFRREGIATQLNAELIRLARSMLSLKLLVSNVVDSNPVVAIFKKYGFKLGGTIPKQFKQKRKYLKMLTFYLKL